MLEPASGDLLQAPVEALVNAVNTVGVMGKGIALQFKQAFPDNYAAYKKACGRNEVQIGSIFVFKRSSQANPRHILNFPTKKHWRDPSRLEYIQSGLVDLVQVVRDLDIHSVAIPALGAGHGGLKWSQVRPLIEQAFVPLSEVKVMVFEPQTML